MSQSLPEWVQSDEDRRLYGAAMAWDANAVVLNNREICAGFVQTKQTQAAQVTAEKVPSVIASELRVIKGLINPIATMVCNFAIERSNLWTNTQMTEVVTEVDKDQKRRFLSHLGLKNPRGRDKVQCMVSGVFGNSESQVIMAHIVPKRSKESILPNIGMGPEHVRDIRNCLLLAKGIEKAFDRLQLSFVKSNPLRDRLYLKIWDHSIRTTPIFKGSPRTIGDFDGARLKLGENRDDPYSHNPFRRALSYQAYIAFMKFKHLNPDMAEPDEFGSDEETEYGKVRRLMKQAVVASIEQELENEA